MFPSDYLLISSAELLIIPETMAICHKLVTVITIQIVSQISPSLYCADFYYASCANLDVLSHVQAVDQLFFTLALQVCQVYSDEGA